MANKTMESVVEQLDNIEKALGADVFKKIFKTITVDNGSEFQDCDGIERHAIGEGKRTKLYYCHPYCSCERGSNENENRLIRRIFPKGYDFTNTKQKEVDSMETWLNNYPREIFNWRCSDDLFNECVAETLGYKISIT